MLSDELGQVDGARSVLAGGTVTGWSPEVAVVLWRRILGCLGNVNNIRDVMIHEEVYEYLCDLVSTLVKVTLHLTVAPIHAKLGRADGHGAPLACAKFHLNRHRWWECSPQNIKNFHFLVKTLP